MTPAIHLAMPLLKLKQGVASIPARMYRPAVAANSATGTPSPESKRSTSSHLSARSFFSPVIYGGVVWEGFAPAGFLLPRPCRPAQRYRLSSASDDGSSSAKGALPMQFSRTQDSSATSGKAAAHRAMAIAALHADSSLSVRLKRYNAHMEQARSLEAVGSVQ